MKKFTLKWQLFSIFFINLAILISSSCNTNQSNNLPSSSGDTDQGDISTDVFSSQDPVSYDFQSGAALEGDGTSVEVNFNKKNKKKHRRAAMQSSLSESTSEHSLTLDLSKQSIGDVDLVISLHNSWLMEETIAKLEKNFKSFLETIQSNIHGNLNTTILSCDSTVKKDETGCLDLEPTQTLAYKSLVDYHVPLSIYGGHMGMGWIKNIVEGQTLLTYDTPSRQWVTIDRPRIFKNFAAGSTTKPKKVFLDINVNNIDDSLDNYMDSFKQHADAQFGKENVVFFTISPKRRNNSCDGTQFDNENRKLAKYYGGKLFSICDLNASTFTKLATRIEEHSWATFDLSSITTANINGAITGVSLNGNALDASAYKVIHNVIPPLLFVDLPQNTANGTTITVTAKNASTSS